MCGLDLPSNISQTAHDIEHHHSEITSGDLMMKGKLLDYFRTPRVPIKTPLGETSAMATSILPLWEVPFRLAERVRDSGAKIAKTWQPYTLTADEEHSWDHHGGGHGGGHAKRHKTARGKFAPAAAGPDAKAAPGATGPGAKFATLAGGDSGNATATPVQYVLINAPKTVAHVLNVSVGLLVEDTTNIIALHTLLQCCVAGAALVLLLGLFLLYYWSFRRINIEKAIALQLFTTIPFGMLEQLLTNADKTLKRFDRPEEEQDERSKLAASLAENGQDGSPTATNPTPVGGEEAMAEAEAEAQALEGNADDTGITNKTTLVLVISTLLLQFLISIAAVLVIYFIMTTQHTIPKALYDREEARYLAELTIENSNFLTSEVRNFAQFADRLHYDKYWALVHSGLLESPLERLLELEITKDEQVSFPSPPHSPPFPPHSPPFPPHSPPFPPHSPPFPPHPPPIPPPPIPPHPPPFPPILLPIPPHSPPHSPPFPPFSSPFPPHPPPFPPIPPPHSPPNFPPCPPISSHFQEEILEANEEEHALILTEEISMIMTVHSHGMDPAAFPEVEGYEWDVKNDLHFFDWSDQHDNGLHYTNRTHDLALPPAKLAQTARSIVFDAKYEELKRRVVDPIYRFLPPFPSPGPPNPSLAVTHCGLANGVPALSRGLMVANRVR